MIVPAFIDGAELASDSVFNSVDPATGEVIAKVSRSSVADVDRAVAAARAATQGVWRAMGARERGLVLRRLASLIERDAARLAELESRDVGKPLAQAKADVAVAARYFDFYGSVVGAFHGETLPSADDLTVYTRREPFGVTAHITPWNYPLQISARTLAPALAAGNCAVHKPAEDTPITAIEVARLAREAGMPDGVLNVVQGPGDVGAALAGHAGIDHVSFTGSVATGRLVAAAAATNVIPSTLELGGKSPNIVFNDADLELAIPTVVNSIIQNAGQTCVAGARLLVQSGVHGTVVTEIVRRFEALTIGRGLDDPDLGPLVNRRQQQQVATLVAGARGSAKLLTGGETPTEGDLAAGSFYLPTLFDEVAPDSPIAQDEVFGPVLVVTPFHEDTEALRYANGTDYGLVAAVWTNDLNRANRFARDLHSGQVFVNTYGAGGGVELPFGGVKRSGHGREKGFEALAGYTQSKTVAIRFSGSDR